MLVEIRVKDLAVIADAGLELGAGLNVLTGETGAGKSMLVDALALLLGERADAGMVRPGAERAVVEGAFEIGAANFATPDLAVTLERLGIEPEEGRLILKREVQAKGKSRAWVNGSPATAGTLAELGALLVDLHGQHETQSLLKLDAQRRILDAFSAAADEARAVEAAWSALQRHRAEKDELVKHQAEARKRADYLRHVADEIGKANPKDGELESLDSEAKRLTHAEELGRTAAELADLLEGDDRSAVSALSHAARLLGALERIDEAGAAGWKEMLETATVNVDELARAIREYMETVESDPVRLASVEKRRDLLFALDRKYGPGLGRVRDTGEEAKRELDMLDTAGTDLADLDQKIADAADRFSAACRELSARRKTGGRRLGLAVSKHLKELGMPDGKMTVALTALEQPGGSGAESVEFMVALNPGMEARPLAKSASGGELSRVMLALKVELARHDAVPTLVFDEVDAGLGGHTAGMVAHALATVAARHQVLVITHLPQIAAAAGRQLVVVKSSRNGSAVTTVESVDGDARVEELARMLGGATTTARRHARELLDAASGNGKDVG